MKRIFAAFQEFPYTGVTRIFFLDYLLLKILTRWSFPKMSIVSLVQQHYDLDSEEEFRVRYYISKIGFDSIWISKDRSTEEATEAFYNEHDADLWRQAYLSKSKYIYKKKILRAYHIAQKIGAKRVLDYGCGAGAIAHYLQQKGFIVDAADIPSPTIAFVKKRLRLNETFVINTELQLPIDEYEFITCLDALEHTFKPVQITKNLLRSLKRGGIFHVTFPLEGATHAHGDHHQQHTLEAQLERPATFAYLREVCDELVPELVYRKR